MSRAVGAWVLGALLAATTLPTGAPAASDPDEPWLVYAASDGAQGVGRLREVLERYDLEDSDQAGWTNCYMTAPLENACTLHGNTTYPAPGGIWLVGWFPPTIPPGITPFPFPNGNFGQGGALVASTQVAMTGTLNAATTAGRCNWATVAYRGIYHYPIQPSWPFLECAWRHIADGRYAGGHLTAEFHASIYDLSIDPDVGPFFGESTGAGVGNVHAVLYAD